MLPVHRALPSAARVVLEELAQPLDHPLPHRPDLPAHTVTAACRRWTLLPQPVQHETYCGRIHGTRYRVNQPGQMKRHAETHREVEDALRELGESGERRAAAGEHETRREQPVAGRALELVLDEQEHLLGARPDDVGERAAREEMRLAAAHARPPDRL